LKAAGLENVHSEPFSFPAWIRGAESAEIVGSAPQHLAVTALGGSVATDANGIEAEIALRVLRIFDPEPTKLEIRSNCSETTLERRFNAPSITASLRAA
jgi:hypothetical protein